MPTTDRYVVKEAFLKSIPIMCSYVFVSMAYGIMMENAGFAWYDALVVSLTVYTGGISVCACDITQQWCFHHYNCVDGFSYE